MPGVSRGDVVMQPWNFVSERPEIPPEANQFFQRQACKHTGMPLFLPEGRSFSIIRINPASQLTVFS